MLPKLELATGPIELANRAADSVCAQLKGAISERGCAHIALTGGSSPAKLYTNLRREPWSSRVDWSRVILWMGDDRFVASDDPNSNAGMARRLLFDSKPGDPPALPVLPENVRFFPVDAAQTRPNGPGWAAAEYAREIQAAIEGSPPVFDIVLLGLGADGHILSVFPGSAAFDPDAALAMAIPAPTHIEPHLPRLTLNPAIVPSARTVIVMAQGEGKAAIVRAVLTEPYDPQRLPGQLAAGENAQWFLDDRAAAEIRDVVVSVGQRLA